MLARPWIFASVLALLTVDARSAEDPKRIAKYQAEMAKVYKAIEVKPVQLDKTVVKPGEKLKATSALVNKSAEDFVIPPVPGTAADAILGDEDWYLRKLDGNKKSERTRRHGLIVRRTELKAGEEIPLKFWAGEVDPKEENLASGRYEISVDFLSTGNKVVGTAAAVFEVVNPDYVDPAVLGRKRKQEGDKLAAYGKEIFASLRLADLTIGSATVKKGVVLQATSNLVNMSKADVVLPDDPVFRTIGKRATYDKRYAIIGMYQWTVEKGGTTATGAGGAVFEMPKDGVFPAGFEMPFNNSIETKDLPAGQYELVLTIRDCANKVVGVKKQRFRVVN
jgi:hypothetical protein